ncbi:lytic transglycosylase domain-containing protein [Alkalihalobacillus sp. BA299]|uniref:lytic transglycosylase domain-containing protein n=1 Tax=Alkalihalobacillus sp. BA299 TaxID=2815938 RepID=UPI001FFE2D03|nr:lytic transglycosylase domain-containing protein [Alkalihalobacillus sp. BA299]
MGKKKKTNRKSMRGRLIFVFAVLLLVMVLHYQKELKRGLIEFSFRDNSIPSCYIPIYQEAAETYSIPWKLLAAIHRVETRFSTIDPMVSSVGAVGHFQFMPRTWVGWGYPGTELGDIIDNVDITDVALISEYGGYGLDASGNGKADPFNVVDATNSAAKYLADHGAANADIAKAVFAYNHSQKYVDKVIHYYDLYNEGYKAEKPSGYCYK